MTFRIAVAGAVGALTVPLLLKLCLWANGSMHLVLNSTLLLAGLYLWLATVIVGIVAGICLLAQGEAFLLGLGVTCLSALSLLIYAQDFIPHQH
jgi:hypothetical protein